MCRCVSPCVGPVLAPCRNLTKYGGFWPCRCRDVTSVKKCVTQGLAPHLLEPLTPQPPTTSLSPFPSTTFCFCHHHFHHCRCHYCCHCPCLWHHQLKGPTLYDFYLSPSRDAVDDQSQPPLFKLNDLTMG